MEKTRKIFVRGSIINHPLTTGGEIYRDINLDFYTKHISNLSNYLEDIPEYLGSGKFWEIKSLSEFIHLRDDIKKLPIEENNRTLEEFTDLLEFIHEEKINLFLGRDIKNDKYSAIFYDQHNSIVINTKYLFNMNSLCSSLTHELIHYLQYDGTDSIPLKIDIEDRILTEEYLNFYDNYYGKENNIGNILRIELEARTFEFFPYFIREYKSNKNQFLISPQRDWTIEWICKNKKLPSYSSQKSSATISFDFKQFQKSIYSYTNNNSNNTENYSSSVNEKNPGCLSYVILIGFLCLFLPTIMVPIVAYATPFVFIAWILWLIFRSH